MVRFAAGVVRFQRDVFPQKKALFEKLSRGQSPEALFITCSDARIETAMITQTDPGELFICRNAGNIVPPYDKHTGAMTASIEFAVAALNVPHIVICGHTECGAMHGIMDPSSVAALPHVGEWLGHSKAAADYVNARGAALDAAARMQMLLERNVILQLAHLKSHPAVNARLEKGGLKLHGWVYDIKTGQVSAYDPAQGKFIPVAERYAEDVARAMNKAGHCGD
jgi:carbonic anhydrase